MFWKKKNKAKEEEKKEEEEKQEELSKKLQRIEDAHEEWYARFLKQE